MRIRRLFSQLFRDAHGGSLVELALVAPILVLMFVGMVDLGRAYYLATEIAGAAESAATYGVQNPTDTAGIDATAKADAPDVPNLTIGTPAYGCECSDGSSYSTNCSTKPSCTANNVVYTMKVNLSTNYSLLMPLSALSPSLSISRSAEMRGGD